VPCLRSWYTLGKKVCPLCRTGLRAWGRSHRL
jgi:hypothetical protein